MTSIESSHPVLEVRDLRTEFRSRGTVVRAVDGISFTVEAGETLAIVGESGCGKSATALSIMGLLPQIAKVVSGEILVDGKNVLTLRPADLRDLQGRTMAMIFQEPMTSLNPVIRIGKQLTETIELHLGWSRKKARQRAIELLRMVQISDGERHLSDYPHQLSGGMRQRVMLAVAMSCGPRLLIADEPTTALDVTVQAQILDMMKQLSHELGVATVFITHNLGLVARYADRVAVMYAGRIVEKATTADLFAAPQHPYTRALLRSVPRLDVAQDTLVAIGGQPPDLSDLPVGCSFAPRCPDVMERCLVDRPPLMGTQHAAACWLVESSTDEPVGLVGR